MLRATELLACDYIHTPTTQELHRIPDRPMDGKYRPFLADLSEQWMEFMYALRSSHNYKECIGIDMTEHHFIMTICDLNMLFTYVWNGASGSCHDTTILTMAQNNDPEFLLQPADKYYVVDFGYPNKQDFLAPYRSPPNMVVRYHMSHNSKILLLLGISRNFINVGMHPCVLSSKGQSEFGKRNDKYFFVIFQDIEVQKRVVVPTMGLHNFIRISNFIDDDFAETLEQSHNENVDLEYNSNDMETTVTAEGDAMANIRKQIANTLWANKDFMY